MEKENEPGNPQKVIIVQLPLELTPEVDPEPTGRMLCHFGHDPKPTIRRRVNYSIEYYRISYVIPGVWANVCEDFEEIYFFPSIGETLLEEIRKESNKSPIPTPPEISPGNREIKGYLGS